MAGRYDFVDEVGPVVWPFLFEDGYQHKIQLVEECLLTLQTLFRLRALDDEVDDKVADALTLLRWQDFPLCHDDIVQDLQPEVFGLWVARILQDLVHQKPGIWILFELVQSVLSLLLGITTTLVEGLDRLVELFHGE